MITQSFFPVHSVCKSIVLEIKVIFPFLYSYLGACLVFEQCVRTRERAYSAKVRECNIQMFIFIFQHKQQQQQ